MSLFTSARLLPRELIENLIELSPEELAQNPYGPLLLVVRVPAKRSSDFSGVLEDFARRGGARSNRPVVIATTTEIPTVVLDEDVSLEADYIGLLSELEDSTHCVLPLVPPTSGGPLSIGRSRTNDIVLADDSVSHTHAEIRFDGGSALVDLNSKNGSHLNGQKLRPGTPAWLQPMDRLNFGAVSAFTCAPRVLRTVLRHEMKNLL